MSPVLSCEIFGRQLLELHQDRQVQTIFDFAKIGQPSVGRRTVTGGEALQANERTGRAVVAAWGSYAAGAGEVGNVCGAVIVFPAERDVLTGHPVDGCGSVPRFVGIAWIRGEMRRATRCGSAVDGRNQD